MWLLQASWPVRPLAENTLSTWIALSAELSGTLKSADASTMEIHFQCKAVSQGCFESLTLDKDCFVGGCGCCHCDLQLGSDAQLCDKGFQNW